MPAACVKTFSPTIGLFGGTRRPENTSTSLLISDSARSSTRVLMPGMIAQRHDHLVERHVARALAHAVDGHVHAVRAGDRRFERVGGAETVVVVAVKIEMAVRKLRDDAPDELAHLQRRQHARACRAA